MCYEECPYFKRKFKGTTHCENLMRKLPITKHVYIGNQIENQRQYIPIRGKEIKENAISHTRTASKGWLVLLDIHLVLFLKKKNGLEGKDM